MRAPLVVALFTPLLLSSVPACSDGDPPPADNPDAAADDGDPDASPPPPDGEFRRFRHTFGGGPCPDDVDCSGYIDLRRDGRLLVDREGELPVVIHEAQVSAGDMEEVVAVLTDPDLVALLDLAQPPCEPPTDVYEDMTLVVDSQRHGNAVTFCDDAPIVAARAALADLADRYLP